MTYTERDDFDPELDELETLTNSVIDHIRAGRLDAAGKVCLELKRRFPDEIDWLDCTARVHAARGEAEQAIEHFRRCIEYIALHPDGFDEESRESYRDEIDALTTSRR